MESCNPPAGVGPGPGPRETPAGAALAGPALAPFSGPCHALTFAVGGLSLWELGQLA